MSNKKLAVILSIVAVFLVVGFVVFRSNGSDDNLNEETTTISNSDTSNNTENASTQTETQLYTIDDVAIHDSETDCWTIVNGRVYDITSYVPRHPGGDEILLACGTDGTSLFAERETDSGETIGSGTPHSSNAQRQLEQLYIGDLES